VAVTTSLRPAWSDAFAAATLRRVPRIDVPLDKDWAWGGATGAGVTVAVVDSGVDAAHPAVGAVDRAIAFRWDAAVQDAVSTEGPHDDLFGHGTACAGIIRRAAPAVTLWSVRVLGSKLTGKGAVFAAGLRWAIEQGAQVVNLSLSTGRAEHFGLFHEIADEAAFAGVVLVCATNNVPAPTYPAQFSSVISVAAHDGRDPFCLDTNPAPPADFGAPGIDIEVPWLAGGTIVATGNSFAAPHVAGLVARLLSKHPHLTAYEVKTVLRAVASNAVAGDGAAGDTTAPGGQR
jgi:subtilisin family serine protease